MLVAITQSHLESIKTKLPGLVILVAGTGANEPVELLQGFVVPRARDEGFRDASFGMDHADLLVHVPGEQSLVHDSVLAHESCVVVHEIAFRGIHLSSVILDNVLDILGIGRQVQVAEDVAAFHELREDTTTAGEAFGDEAHVDPRELEELGLRFELAEISRHEGTHGKQT